MAEGRKRSGGRSRLAVPKTLTPDWFGWLGVAAMVLLSVVRIAPSGTIAWFFPLLSFGEWLLMPLGAASLGLGLLTLMQSREKTLLPLWVSAILPGVFWLIGVGLAVMLNGASPAQGDSMLALTVQTIFPVMAFLPLLAQRIWRNRLMWGLTCGLGANVALIAIQTLSGGIDADPLAAGGFLSHQHDYAVFMAVSLPLIIAWRGGEIRTNKALIIMICTFLLPAMALGACYTMPGIIAAAAGLAVSWAAWRNPGWILGIFICLLIFGYGGTAKKEREQRQRQNLVATLELGTDEYTHALEIFVEQPYFGTGPSRFLSGNGVGQYIHSRPGHPVPWYATLLGGTGLTGFGLWLVLLAELAARALGRTGKRSLWSGGVLGATAALAVCGLWTEAMPEGAGALVGLLLAISMLDEPETELSPRRAARRHEREVAAKVEAAKRETIVRLKEGEVENLINNEQ